uniref:Uncharacterized protein n=1 Tax=Hyaloperonospora arabidopsidis (strain Emoy2) TaxID=559515 RepID=M4BRJ6_HYAAE
MPLMAGSPRPGTSAAHEEDTGVYRSLFQQPVVDVPPRAPSYAWFEFLLHPEALQKHLTTLRQQQKCDAHGATSAIELVREFLEQAQLVADEGNVRNKRYSALLLVAAQVALQMQLSLSAMEQTLPLHFQRLLLDGIVDFAEQPRSSRNNDFTRDVFIQPHEAHVLHKRWTLRALVKQSQNGYLTGSSRSEGEEILSTYQIALGDLMASHLQIAQSIQAILMGNDEKQELPAQSQVDTYFDLGVYFFSFNGYEKAYSCFSRALELIEKDADGDETMDKSSDAQLSPEDRANLEGYLTACEAVLEVQSANESPALLKTTKVQIEMAWEARDWDKVVKLLERDMVALELTRLPPGYRAALEQQALRLLRSSCDQSADEGLHVASSAVRFFYKRIVMENAVMALLLEGDVEETMSIEACVCTCIRLLYDEIFYLVRHSVCLDDEAEKRFVALARFMLTLGCFALANSPNASAGGRIKQFLIHVIHQFSCIASIEGATGLLHSCGIGHVTENNDSVPVLESLGSAVAIERRLQSAVAVQREHFRMMADVGSMFAFSSAKTKDEFITALKDEVAAMSEVGSHAHETRFATDKDNGGRSPSYQNLISFCAANYSWKLLSQCKDLVLFSSHLRHELDLAVVCGTLAEYVSSLAPSVSAPSAKVSSVGADVSFVSETQSDGFSIVTSIKLVTEILLKCREWADAVRASLADNSGDEERIKLDVTQALMYLPLRIVETLVCVSAGLLHRASMYNMCGYRVSFDLTPYGDLAFLEAFAPDTPSTASGPGSSGSTVSFLKNFQGDLVRLHFAALESLVCRCNREPRWHCAKADILLNPLSKQRSSSTSGESSCLA